MTTKTYTSARPSDFEFVSEDSQARCPWCNTRTPLVTVNDGYAFARNHAECGKHMPKKQRDKMFILSPTRLTCPDCPWESTKLVVSIPQSWAMAAEHLEECHFDHY